MAPVEVTVDYYAVLEMSNTATSEVVTKSYRRLAKIRHPDKNPNKESSTAAFQLLQNAYDTISDPEKRRAYDTRWTGIRNNLRAQQESDKRQAEAADTEGKRATEAKAKKQREDDAGQERLQPLELLRIRYDIDVFEASRVVRKLTADLKRLQDQDDEDLKKEGERNSCYGNVVETNKQKQTRETERLHRLASKSIKETELHRKKAKLQELQSALQKVNNQIAAEKKKADDARAEARGKTRRMEQEARSRAQQEMREKCAKAQKEQAECAAKEVREAQAAREAREAREAQHDGFRPATPSETSFHSSGSAKRSCRHNGFWPKVEGRHLCSNCHTHQTRFAFQCPGCSTIACAKCRQTLRGGARKGHNAGRRFSFDSDNDYDADFF